MKLPHAVGATVAIAAVTASTSSFADEPSATMAYEMRSYFDGELNEGAAFLGVGIGTAYIGGSLIPTGDLGTGAAAAILPVSAIQIGAGLVLIVRTKGQLRDLLTLHGKNPAAYRREELPRMQRVNFWFDVYMVAEVSLMALGGASLIFGVADDRPGFVGAGVGLAAQSGAMLTFDLFASRRADRYTHFIERLTPVVGPTSIGLQGQF
jgi:hypothetical protein